MSVAGPVVALVAGPVVAFSPRRIRRAASGPRYVPQSYAAGYHGHMGRIRSHVTLATHLTELEYGAHGPLVGIDAAGVRLWDIPQDPSHVQAGITVGAST